jgi:hypothetical protein
MLVTSNKGRLYQEKLGMRPFQPGAAGLQIWEEKGPGSALQD